MNKRMRRRLVKTKVLRSNGWRRARRRLARHRRERTKLFPLSTRPRAGRSRGGIRRTNTRNVVVRLCYGTTSVVMQVTIKMIGDRSLASRKPRRGRRYYRNTSAGRSRITCSTRNGTLLTLFYRLYATCGRRGHVEGVVTRRGVWMPTTTRSGNNHYRRSRRRPPQLRLFGAMIRYRRRGNGDRSRARPIQLYRRDTRSRRQVNRRPKGTSSGVPRLVLSLRGLPSFSHRADRRRRGTKGRARCLHGDMTIAHFYNRTR